MAKKRLLLFSVILVILIAVLFLFVESVQIHKAVHINMRKDFIDISNTVKKMDEMLTNEEQYDEQTFLYLSEKTYDASQRIYITGRSDFIYAKYKCYNIRDFFSELSSGDVEISKYKNDIKELAEVLQFTDLENTDIYVYNFANADPDLLDKLKTADAMCERFIVKGENR